MPPASAPTYPPATGLTAALDVLANSVLVGRRHEPAKFLQGCAEFFEIDPGSLPPTPQFATVAPLARLLRESGEVDIILEKDLELYHYVETAAKKAP